MLLPNFQTLTIHHFLHSKPKLLNTQQIHNNNPSNKETLTHCLVSKKWKQKVIISQI